MSYVTTKVDNRVIKLLKTGGIGFMPSDTIYGISCAAFDEAAVKQLHEIKDRSANKPFIILISSINHLKLLGIDKDEAQPVFKYWPGPISAILSAHNSPEWLRLSKGSLAVRLPDNKELINLINEVGPLISTSANLQGELPATNYEGARSVFGGELDFYIDKGDIVGVPSTIVAVENNKLKVLRQGAKKIDEF